MTRAQIRDVRATADDDTFQLEVDVRFPKLISEGKFKGEGRFNAIKIVSKGFFNITFSKKIELILNFCKVENLHIYFLPQLTSPPLGKCPAKPWNGTVKSTCWWTNST